MHRSLFLLIAMSFSLSACSLAPEYHRPTPELPAAWTSQSEQSTPGQRIETQWWKRFEDNTLNTLVDEALKNNLDLEQALARVEQAAAQLGTARSALAPTPSLSGSASRSVAGGGSSNEFSGNAGMVSWELDLWGKARNQAQSAKADMLATEAGRDAVLLSVAGNTVKGYFWLRAYSLQEQNAERVLRTREEAHEIYANRYAQGQINELDLLRDEAEVESARNTLYTIRIAKDAAESSLAVLLGRSPADIMRKNAVPSGNLTLALPVAPILPGGLPSDLLERRPDIRQAEESLKSANFSIGTAKAAYFPSLSLTGLLGVVSPQLSNLFSANSDFAQGESAVRLPLDIWRTRSTVRGAEARTREATAGYGQTVQKAFQDMRDALMRQSEYALSVKSLERQVEVLSTAVTHARNRYNNGYSSYLELLDAERSLFGAQLDLISTRASQLAAIADVCLALGGGWAGEDEKGEGGR